MNDDDPESLGQFAGVLYIRHRITGKLCRYNVEFLGAETDNDDPHDKAATWRFTVITTTPFKLVPTAR